MRPALHRTSTLLSRQLLHTDTFIPTFLCPVLLQQPAITTTRKRRPLHPVRALSTSAAATATAVVSAAPPPPNYGAVKPQSANSALPISCPGCGAPTQTVEPNEAGYYSTNRPNVKAYLNGGSRRALEDKVFRSVVQHADNDLLGQLGMKDAAVDSPAKDAEPPPPVCDRCHKLVHHHSGVSIHHPSLDTIEAMISQSPHKYNHIYHVIDAADFPMSLIPNLNHKLSLAPLRTQNRRSKSVKYHKGRLAEVSFIVTRSDLLAPTKEQVDRLMPYLRSVLRDALGRSGHNVRLGNVRCVSSKRGWWTKEVKEDIYSRGGGNWLVGKANVGKSKLFEVVFPKGRNQTVDFNALRSNAGLEASGEALESNKERMATAAQDARITGKSPDTAEYLDEDPENTNSLLPPPQAETAYPAMPIVSALPGTTASPIRVPFGNNKGELIDLPGLLRGKLDTYVRPERKLDLIMQNRVVPERVVVKPGQSLLLGGLIRITATTPDLVLLAYPFVPLPVHVTSTEKAMAIQTGERATGIDVIAEPWAGEKTKSAGRTQLKWDTTKIQGGPLTAKSAVGLKPERLPFTIYSADILVEGCGWVELVAQIRKSKQLSKEESSMGDGELQSPSEEHDPDSLESTPAFPEVEVFSPEGRGIAVRRPMNASQLNSKRPAPSDARKSRPRRSMRSVKAQRTSQT
ncbi:Mitochondrial ribosome small subunit biogenesis protein [Coniosporium apollinis]|uniref:Mitochondrial ribosome small subunit biogenesis protein n=1 Tax=Coniosporium apollinis TaxID=61459 RepID=A0ABQ9NTT6_9PEZI|nr:Mitochondrial ribosome small subunit biogenesis protein [Coniosporium apollinis]